jgi:hypothetical protein
VDIDQARHEQPEYPLVGAEHVVEVRYNLGTSYAIQNVNKYGVPGSSLRIIPNSRCDPVSPQSRSSAAL